MAKKQTKPVQRVSRGRRLTPEEAAKYSKLRAEVEAEKPQIEARIRARRAAAAALRTVCEQLRSLREAQGKSLADVRELTGIDRSMLSGLETGRRDNPSLETLVRYAQALGKRVEVSLTDEG